jgi:hypothetical protein
MIESVSSISITVPASSNADSTQLIIVNCSREGAVTCTGFTEVCYIDSGSYTDRCTVLKREGTYSEASHSVSLGATVTYGDVLAFAVQNGKIDAYTTIDHGYRQSPSGPQAPTVTAARNDTAWVQIVGTQAWGRYFDLPSGVTAISSMNNGNWYRGTAAGYKSVASGATGTGSVWLTRELDEGVLTGDGVFAISLAMSTPASATAATISGGGEFPYTYATTSISATPATITGDPVGTETITIVDQNGIPVEGATASTSNAAVCTVSTPSNSAGTVTATKLAAGTATLTISYDDSMSSAQQDTVAVTLSGQNTAEILCLGDEFVVGDEASSNGYRSFRGELQLLLSNGNYLWNFAGTQSSSPASGGLDPDHCGFAGDSIDTTVARLSSIRSTISSCSIIIVMVGWKDVLDGNASATGDYTTLVNNLVSATNWPTAKLVLCTLPPQVGKTEAQTGTTYPVYSSLNTHIRSLASASRIIADLASVTGASASALLDLAIYDAQTAPDTYVTGGGKSIPNVNGGHRVTSWASITGFNGQWTATPPNPQSSLTNPVDSLAPPNNAFINRVGTIKPWFWPFTTTGHASTNTGIEVRNFFAMAWTPTGWREFFAGLRGSGGSAPNNLVQYWDGPQPGVGAGATYIEQRADGITTFYQPVGDIGIEAWATPTAFQTDVSPWLPGLSRSTMVDAVCFWWGCQARLALRDPDGPNDIGLARFAVRCGADFYTDHSGGTRHYDRYGWPYDMMDGGQDRTKLLTSTEWTYVGSLSLGRGGSTDAESHRWDGGTSPPLGFFDGDNPYNNIATYAKTVTQIRATPPPIPSSWAGTSTGWQTVDYWLDPATSTRSIYWSQSGADRAAQAIYDRMVASGILDAFVDGGNSGGGGTTGSTAVLLPGLIPGSTLAYFDRFDDAPTNTVLNVVDRTVAVVTAPVWPDGFVSLPTATVGTTYTATLVAAGATSYSHISGKPSWMSVASNGAITGTPTGSDATHSIVLRATNSAGNTDATVSMIVTTTPTITTTTLPGAVQNVAYNSGVIAVSGTGPFTYTLQSGTLPTGLSLVGAVITGTPTGTGTSNFTIRATGPNGTYDDQALSIVVVAGGTVPAITVTTLPGGTTGSAYSQSVTATGSGTLAWALASGSLPPGLSLNSSSGLISGTPTTAGSYVFTVQVSNAYGTASQGLFIYVGTPVVGGTDATVESPWGRFLRG